MGCRFIFRGGARIVSVTGELRSLTNPQFPHHGYNVQVNDGYDYGSLVFEGVVRKLLEQVFEPAVAASRAVIADERFLD